MSTATKPNPLSYVTTAGSTAFCPRCSSTIYLTGPDGNLIPAGCNCTPITSPYTAVPYTNPSSTTITITKPDFSAEKALQEAFDKASTEDTELDLGDLLKTVETLRASYKTLEERLRKIEDRHEKKKARRKLEKHKQKKHGTLLKG